MSDLIEWIKKQVAKELIIYLNDVKNLSHEVKIGTTPKFYVGDGIEFDVHIKNGNPFPLHELDISIHQVEAVEFQDAPINVSFQNLAGGEERKVATVTGVVRKNPDDAKSAWRFLDRVCRVTVKGQVDLPPIDFQDEEFEVAHIEDA